MVPKLNFFTTFGTIIIYFCAETRFLNHFRHYYNDSKNMNCYEWVTDYQGFIILILNDFESIFE